MSYILEEFINSNTYNVVFEKPTHEEANATFILKHNFQENIVYDTINEQALPVIVYEKEGEPVAWFDIERTHGFIKV